MRESGWGHWEWRRATHLKFFKALTISPAILIFIKKSPNQSHILLISVPRTRDILYQYLNCPRRSDFYEHFYQKESVSPVPSLNVLMCCQTCVTHEGRFIWNIRMTPSYVFGKHSQMQYPLGSMHTDGHTVTKISYWICVRFRHFMLDCFSPKRSLKRVLVIYMFSEITLRRRNNTVQNIVVAHTST